MGTPKNDWETYYRENELRAMPWFRTDLDQDFEAALAELNLTSGTVLDLGTGPGTQAIAMAKRGFEVTGSDIAASAVAKAATLAENQPGTVKFVQDNILETNLAGGFDIILDRGCFHTLNIESRPAYVRQVCRILRPGGILLLKCFSHKEPGNEGPHRIHPREIEAVFPPLLRIDSVTDSLFLGDDGGRRQALFCCIRKSEASQ